MKIINGEIMMGISEAEEYILTSRYTLGLIAKKNNLSTYQDEDGNLWFKEAELKPIREDHKAKGASITYFASGTVAIDTMSPGEVRGESKTGGILKIINGEIMLHISEAWEYALVSRPRFDKMIQENNLSMLRNEDGIWFKESELTPLREQRKKEGVSITYYEQT